MTCPERVDTLTITVAGEPDDMDTWTFTDTAGVMGFAATSAGPFSSPFDVSVTYDGAGMAEQSVSMRASSSPLATSGHTTVRATNGSETLTIGLFINEVTAVELTELDGSALGANPAGGLRFYPEAPTLGEPEERTIRVTAQLRYPAAGLSVLFDGWDVDDPGAGDRDGDSDPIDNSGNSEAVLSARSATTASDGTATVEFDTPRFAGDNFRMFASCSASYLFSIRPDGTDLEDPDGDTLPTPGAAVSEMLTMWRHVHVEVDTMEPVDGNQVIGKVARITQQTDGTGNPQTAVEVRGTKRTVEPRPKRVVMADAFDVDTFVGGQLTVLGTRYDVVTSIGDLVLVNGLVPTSARRAPFVLVDDDNVAGGPLDGDEGDPVPAPDTSLFASTMASAYLSPVLHTGGTAPYVDFDLDSGSADMTTAYRFDRAGLKSRSSWVTYQLGAYEFFRQYDGDPQGDSEFKLGQADLTPGNSLGTAVFAESIRDNAATLGATPKCSAAGTAVHELFHLLSVTGHAADGLMSRGCNASAELSAETLKQVRGLLVPGQPLAAFPTQTVPPVQQQASAQQAAATTTAAFLGGIRAE